MKVRERQHGFELMIGHREPIKIQLEPWRFEIIGGPVPPTHVGLGCPDVLVKEVERRLGALSEQRPPTDETSSTATGITHQTSHRLVEAQCERLTSKVPKTVLAIQRIVYKTTGRAATITEQEHFFADSYLVGDVLTYCAAQVGMAFLDELASIEPLLRGGYCCVDDDEASFEHQLVFARNWRGLFSPSGDPYRSLNRTLMNLPSRFPPRLLLGLPRIRLPRPITSHIELAALCSRALCGGGTSGPTVGASQLRTYAHATEAQICTAVERLGLELGRPLSATRASDLDRAVRVMASYPLPHDGGIVGLADKTIRWRREQRREGMRELLVETGLPSSLRCLETPTALPPFPLLRSQNIRLLRTVEAIIVEAKEMKNCLVQYTSAAVDGRSYLFHVDYGDETACVELRADGRVMQAVGPRNTWNVAAAWGRRRLAAWWARRTTRCPSCRAPLPWKMARTRV